MMALAVLSLRWCAFISLGCALLIAFYLLILCMSDASLKTSICSFHENVMIAGSVRCHHKKCLHMELTFDVL